MNMSSYRSKICYFEFVTRIHFRINMMLFYVGQYDVLMSYPSYWQSCLQPLIIMEYFVIVNSNDVTLLNVLFNWVSLNFFLIFLAH